MVNWIVGGGLFALYVASPYYTLYQLQRAVGERDVASINRLVDWPILRRNLKDQVKEYINSQTALASADFMGAVGTQLGKKIALNLVDPMIDALSAETVLSFAPGPASATSPIVAPLKLVHVKWAFFSSPIDFKVQLGDDGSCNERGAVLVLGFMGTGWKVIDFRAPRPSKACLERLAEEQRQLVEEQNRTLAKAKDDADREFTKSMDELNRQLRRKLR